MAVIFMDGFDPYTTTIGLLQSPSWVFGNTPTFTAGRFGGQACRLNNNADSITALLPSSYSAISVGFAWFIDSFAGYSNQPIVDFVSNAGIVVDRLHMLKDGALRVTRGDSPNSNILGNSAPGIFLPAMWNYFEVELVRDAVAGAVRVYLNGMEVINVAGVNTGADDISRINFQGNTGRDKDIDDFYVVDSATRLGECRVELIRPDADTAVKAWTPSTGTSNFAMVDEVPFNGDTDYVSSGTPGATDLYDLSPLVSPPTTIFCVQTVMAARKDEAGAREVRSKIDSVGNQANGASRTVTNSYQAFIDLFNTNPAGGPWDNVAIGSLKVGIEVTV